MHAQLDMNNARSKCKKNEMLKYFVCSYLKNVSLSVMFIRVSTLL